MTTKKSASMKTKINVLGKHWNLWKGKSLKPEKKNY